MSGIWKTARVFISSTFRDMHAERDHLIRVVFPALRERLERYRIYLDDVDLRWGVTREQAENGQVLELVLKEVERCRPFFIGLLGERYGWTPAEMPTDAVTTFGWIREYRGASVTELEILHAALRDPALCKRSFFYFRDPAALADIPDAIRQDLFVEPDAGRRLRLANLKDRLRACGCPVTDPYPARWDASAERLVGLEAFGERVREQLWEAIRADYHLPDSPPPESALDPLAVELDYHERFMESRLRVHVLRRQINDALLAFAETDATVPCLVTGPSGSGKSTTLARFALDFQQTHPGALVVPHFIGSSPRSTSLREMLRRFCTVLKAHLGLADEVPEELPRLTVAFREFVSKVPPGRRVVFVIDALNQLDETDQAQTLAWLPVHFPPQVKVVVSCISDSESTEPAQEAFTQRQQVVVEIPPMEEAARREIIQAVPSLSAKTLDSQQIEQLLANPATKNPLFLLVALEELRGFGSYERLNERIAAFPQEGDTVTAIFTQVIGRLEAEFNRQLVEAVLVLLASARRGLYEREQQDLVAGLDGADDLFPVLRQLRPYLLARAGLIDFYHRNLRKAVCERYLRSEEQQGRGHARLAEYFNAQDHWQESPEEQQRRAGTSPRTQRPANVRKVDELPWHLLKLSNYQTLFHLLGDMEFLEVAWQQDQEDVLRYWHALESQSSFSMLTCYTPERCQPARYAWAPARLLLETGKLPQAKALWETVVEDCRSRRDPELNGALNNLGIALEMLRDFDGALRCYAEQAQLCAAREDAYGLQAAFGNMGNVAFHLGDLDRALAYHQEQERLCRALHDEEDLHRSLGNQGLVLAERGDLDGALELYRQQEEICRRIGNRRSLHIALINQANVAFLRRDLAGAETLATSAASAFRELGASEYLWGALALLGQIQLRQGVPEAAKPLYAEAERICRELGTTHYLAEMLFKFGAAALESFVEIRQPRPTVYHGLEEYQRHLARQDRTVDYLEVGANAFRQALDLRPDWPEANYGLARVLEFQGCLPEAIAAYEAALQFRPDWPELCARLGALLVRQEESHD